MSFFKTSEKNPPKYVAVSNTPEIEKHSWTLASSPFFFYANDTRGTLVSWELIKKSSIAPNGESSFIIKTNAPYGTVLTYKDKESCQIAYRRLFVELQANWNRDLNYIQRT